MKSTLTVAELTQLEKELVGAKDQRTNATISKGLLAQKISGDKKYDLLELWEEVLAPNKKSLETIQNDLIRELGVEDDQGTSSIPGEIEQEVPAEGENPATTIKVTNPAIAEFLDKLQVVLDKEKEFEHAEFTKDILDFNSEEVYPVFNKLLRLIKKQKESK